MGVTAEGLRFMVISSKFTVRKTPSRTPADCENRKYGGPDP
jgi:hypothetical protein